jgi:hypothetical protein
VKSLKKVIQLIFIAISLIFFGYLRDFIFKKINALLQAWDHDMDYDMPNPLIFLTNWEYDSVKNFKWILTLIFWGIYLLITLITVKILFRKNSFIKITSGVFIGILLISGLFMLAGFLINSTSEKMYEFARYLMGMAQSPIILMILIPLFGLFKKENSEIAKRQQINNRH